jgi:ABC-2 type transport system permease protein
MNGALALAKREYRSFFASPIAYVVVGCFLLVAGGIFFFINLFLSGQASMRGFFGLAPLLFVFLVPAITMRAVAEERKTGSLELLLTFPMDDWQVTAGKFLSSLAMVMAALACTVPYAVTVSLLTAPGPRFDWGPVFAGYLGLTLLASSFIALGLWGSALSKNQIVGFIVGVVVCFAFYIVDKFAPVLPDALAPVAEFLSVDYHFDNIARGVLDTRDLLFYFSLTLVGLLLTTRQIQSARN